MLDKHGNYVVQLIVKDPQNAASSPDSVQISTLNSPPLANAGPDQTVLVTQTVTLDGHLSSDADGDPLSYAWSLTQKPSGSGATLNLADPVHPTFVIDKPGSYTARLIVNDGIANSLADFVVVTTENSPPVRACRAQPKPFRRRNRVLDGSGSSDVDGDPLTYAWSLTQRPAGSAAPLSDPRIVNPSFGVDKPGTYIAQLIVNDGHVDTAWPARARARARPARTGGPRQGPDRRQLRSAHPCRRLRIDDVDGDP